MALKKSEAEIQADAEQLRLHNAASKWIGTFASGDRGRSEKVRQAVRQRLRRRHAR
jgi:hypothetical protein